MLTEKLIPFERNRYFYGKLLTAADFETEQEYINNKRRLANKLTYGAGVLCGMEVLRADETSLVVEAGIAFDDAGREIVIPQPVVRKLSAFDGYGALDAEAGAGESIRSVYLCAGYREEPADPVHSVAKSALSDENDGPEFSTIRERYALFLTRREPDSHPSASADAAFHYRLLWNADGIRITQAVPRYVSAGEVFYLETRVDKGICRRPVSFSYHIALEFITTNGEDRADITFDEPSSAEQTEYRIRTPLTASVSVPHTGVIRADGFTVSVGGTRTQTEISSDYAVHIRSDARLEMLEARRREPLHRRLDGRALLYLARIHLVQTQDYYVIDRVVTLPFGQYALTPADSHSLYLRGDGTAEKPSVETAQLSGETETHGSVLRAGMVKVSIPYGAKEGQCFYSAQIPHELGPGPVFIQASPQTDSGLLYGDGSIFACPFTWCTSLNTETGMFEVGLKLTRADPPREVCFHWQASRQPEPPPYVKPVLSLHPGVCYVAQMETVRFEARGIDWRPGGLAWSVYPEKGGRISETGVFTASGQTGFYEIHAESLTEPGLKATAYVVVQ